jgi:hypothetical protein
MLIHLKDDIFCLQSPTTSHQEACRYVATDLTAQLCLRIVLWLEGLASEALDLDKKVREPMLVFN